MLVVFSGFALRAMAEEAPVTVEGIHTGIYDDNDELVSVALITNDDVVYTLKVEDLNTLVKSLGERAKVTGTAGEGDAAKTITVKTVEVVKAEAAQDVEM
jgi:hypothetical protein